MKSATTCMLAMVSSLVLVPAPAVHAQIVDHLTFQAAFPFTAGHTTFPAGSYEVTPVDNEPTFLEIANANGTQRALVEFDPSRRPSRAADAQITFKKYGDKYLLKSIYAPDGTGVTLKATPTEKAHARSGQPTDQNVAAKRKG